MVKLIDIQTLSSLLSVKVKTIYDWVHENRIPHFKIGKLVRFDEHEIMKWLENKKATRPYNRVKIP
jgi:excisionase family DNA binding protein